jgi:hypothetical protein
VVCHGDYCFPNALLDADGVVTGFLDSASSASPTGRRPHHLLPAALRPGELSVLERVGALLRAQPGRSRDGRRNHHREPRRELAHLILAAVDEAALLIAYSDDPETARPNASDTLGQLLDGLRQ